jgi:DNA-binding transcriptional LysR family regulator
MERVRDLNDMFLFAQVVEAGSYTAAARALGLQTSRLSRRVAGLERELGVRLLHRTTRRLSLSEAGQLFYRHCVALLAEADAATEAIEQVRSEPRGLVRISCPFGLLESHVAAVLAGYLAEHPQARVRVDATNRRVDLVEEGVDIAVRVRQPPLEDSDLAVRVLARSQMVLVGSPALFARHGRPTTLEELARLPTLAMTQAGDRYLWNFRDVSGATATLPHAPRLATDDMSTLRRAALAGVGVTQLPRDQVSAEVAAGRLVEVLPELSVPAGLVHAVFPSRRGLVPAVRVLLDALVEGFGGEGGEGGGQGPPGSATR